MQEDLAKMFAQHMSFSRMEETPRAASPAQSPIDYSISQHYTHSAHIPSNNVLPANSDVPTSTLVPSPEAGIKEVLARHGIDPSRLLPSQITLFQLAALDQQTRLLELWHISPPEYTEYGAADLSDELGSWQHTTLEQEEEMARLRYQRKVSSGATNCEEPTNNRVNGGQVDSTYGNGDQHAMEPYIKSGYEVLAERDYNQQANIVSYPKEKYLPSMAAHSDHYSHSIDPAYSGKGWWEVYSEQPMEHQYGMFDQMSQMQSQTQTAGGSFNQEDEEML
ncbi:hypothetical protein MMC19_006989 [Ptychographa xylographoides]|nr:hypothetical protein [Ptychographa xylographoides]